MIALNILVLFRWWRFYEIQMIKDHKDQYDRTIIAQAASTGFTVLSDDSKFPFYPIELISNNS